MPHMAPMAIASLVIQVIAKLAPLIQQMFSNTDNSAEKYSAGETNLKDYTNQLNARLQTLREQAKASNIDLHISEFNKVDSADEARSLAIQFQAIVDKIDGGHELQELKGDVRNQIVSEIGALNKAVGEFEAQGERHDKFFYGSDYPSIQFTPGQTVLTNPTQGA